MTTKKGNVTFGSGNNAWKYSLALSFVINFIFIVIIIKLGIFPTIKLSTGDSIEVSLSDILTEPEEIPRPAEAPTMPEFGFSSSEMPPTSSLPQSKILDAPPAPLAITPPAPTLIPPSPISTLNPNSKNTVYSSPDGKGSTAQGSGGGKVLPGGGYTSKTLVGGLEIPEKKLMVVTPNQNMRGPIIMIPDEYKRSLRARAGGYLLEMKKLAEGYALNDEFVSAVIAHAELVKPDAIYWLHFTIYGEHPPARQKLADWLKKAGIPMYVSSWDLPVSPEFASAIIESGGAYEQRHTYERSVVELKTTPMGTALIKDTIVQYRQWSDSLQKEANKWKVIVQGFGDSMGGRRSPSRKHTASTMTVSIMDTTTAVHVPKEYIDPESWDSPVGGRLNKEERESRVMRYNTQTGLIVSTVVGGERETYIVERDSKTGMWVRRPESTADDLIEKKPKPEDG